jgi:hypothetical protein
MVNLDHLDDQSLEEAVEALGKGKLIKSGFGEE